MTKLVLRGKDYAFTSLRKADNAVNKKVENSVCSSGSEVLQRYVSELQRGIIYYPVNGMYDKCFV